ncbi:transcription termination/antitermination protein NusA [Candidatus Falkowbacteria bacterium CG10_big_fil_rev_8_21_14_0_10_43_11]|uniref:Transcription termination/antitermination protein NusA n=1 Tax=Candidatus Falkowbacteria bacterium CG10_big_fil_rev_8_21_14_0_10_43_11 TaxID=1974568 RepID=A0A2M6WMH9_9BACT|nr:MAG: transcription termination/antitermination protein NusA [Candidatus Falkowbacteria bacterium CG10_big_fil_rev_8_21_14_0_10_43_11]
MSTLTINSMSTNEIAAAARAICEEKGIALEAVIEAIEAALAAAYRKDFGQKNQNIKVDFDLETAASKVYDEKTVVEDLPPEEELESEKLEVSSGEENKESEKLKVKSKKTEEDSSSFAKATEDKQETEEVEEDGEEKRRFNPRTELQLKDALLIKPDAKIGDIIHTDMEVPAEYGRMAAQTAKQVIIQRLREVERVNLMEEFKDKEHEVITGVIQRREGRVVLVDLGRTAGILTGEGQVPGERYESGQRLKVYVEEVRSGAKGPEIVLSRTSEEIVRKIFMLEIPEISNGLVEIKSIAREAGSRTKIAVTATDENVDPIGSCVGQRGARIQTVIQELGGEKVDIIEYNEDPAQFVIAALAPAKVVKVDINERDRMAVASVAADQLSLAIGRGGQNVRLAAKLTGWRIDIKEAKTSEKLKVKSEKEVEEKVDGEENSEEQIVNSEQGDKTEKGQKVAAEILTGDEKPKKKEKKIKKLKVENEKEEVKSKEESVESKEDIQTEEETKSE